MLVSISLLIKASSTLVGNNWIIFTENSSANMFQSRVFILVQASVSSVISLLIC